MKWLLKNTYNRYDAIWLVGVGASISHGEFLLAIVLVLAGAISSSILEVVCDA